jgi:hypothetical protein
VVKLQRYAQPVTNCSGTRNKNFTSSYWLMSHARHDRRAVKKQFAKTTQAAEGRKNNTGGPKAARAYP